MRNGIFTYQFICLFAGATLFAVTANMVQAKEDRIPVGTVNGETIWLDEVMRQAERLPAKLRQAPIANYFDQLLTDMVDSRIAANAARTAKYDTKEEIASAMKTAADRVLAESWIGDKIAGDVNEKAIKKAYQTYTADTASREQVTAAHILVATENEAEAIITSLKSGADFAELAKSKSTGPSGPNGGSLGTFSRGQMVPAFENAAFMLGIGKFTTQPVQTQFGWHVIKIEAKEIAPAPSIDAMHDQLVQTLSTQALGRVLEELRARQDISLRSFDDIRKDAMAAGKDKQ
jgi:peptidyl-prolyl cis-trans isomerase C